MIDLNNIQTVEKAQIRRRNYDLLYNLNSSRFTVSSNFYRENNLQDNGFTLHKAYNEEEGATALLLSVQSNEDSTFYRGREDKVKLEGFFNSTLSQEIDNMLGNRPEDVKGNAHITLTKVGDKDGAAFYEVIINAVNVREKKETLTEIA